MSCNFMLISPEADRGHEVARHGEAVCPLLDEGLARSRFCGLRPMRILLIENNEDDVRLIQEKLAWTKEPVALECADRLSTGLERLAAGGPGAGLLGLG